jgi:DNA mismatch endonuclease (patch repair protein)
MADVFTPEKRSEVMSRIHGGGTKPELLVRAMLHRMGYRFTVNGPRNRGLPGRPDLVSLTVHPPTRVFSKSSQGIAS